MRKNIINKISCDTNSSLAFRAVLVVVDGTIFVGVFDIHVAFDVDDVDDVHVDDHVHDDDDGDFLCS